MRCPRCGYDWESKVPNPKECPRCKGRMDYAPGSVGAPKFRIEKKEVNKSMSGRIPWVAATVVIVIVAGLGAWALSTPTTTNPSSASGAQWGAISSLRGATLGPGVITAPGTVSAELDINNGIENIFIMKYGVGNLDDNLDDETENWLGVIGDSGGSLNIPYETNFDIVVACKLKSPENVAYRYKENARVYLNVTGAFTFADNSKENQENPYDNTGTDTNGRMSFYVRFDNYTGTTGHNAWKLLAGQQVSLDNIILYGWK